MKFLPEQEGAILTPADKLIIIAAAGSGKTHVLVQRYLALLEQAESLRIPSLIAITFTRAAAREMKERVREYVHTRIQNAADDEEKQRWSDRLSELPSARIQTIHSLCADILRANAAILGLDLNFRVLDEAETGILLDDAIEDALSADERAPTRFYELFVRFRGRDIRETLRKVKLPLPPIADAESLFAAWLSEWEDNACDRINGFLNTYSGLDLLPPEDDKLGERWATVLASLAAMRAQEDLILQYQCLQEIGAISLGSAGRAGKWGGKEAKAAALQGLKHLVNGARTLVDVLGEAPGELDRQCAEDIQRWQELITRVEGRYCTQKAEQNAVDFDDLENLCHQLLADDTVRARYRSEFSHVLVDEFQDTNQRQWQIIHALTEKREAATLFAVGDPRQSIYAFRGADVRVFNRLIDRVGQEFEKHSLSTSFRTHARLLRAMNDFFAQLFSPAEGEMPSPFEVSFGEPLQTVRKDAPNDEAAVELLCVNQSRLKDLWQRTDRPAARRWEAYLLAGRLKELVESKTLIQDKATGCKRPLDYSDIGILFRSLSQITLYERVFSICGLPYSTYAGRGFYERQEIWDVINFLAALDNPHYDLALASVLRSPIGNLSDDALFALRAESDDTVTERVSLHAQVERAATGEVPLFPDEEMEQIQQFAELYKRLSTIRGRVSVFELISKIYEQSRYPAIVSAPVDDGRARNNLEKLLDVARARGDITISDFLAYVRNMRSRDIHVGQSTPETQRTVSIMTVHACKGLEFPLVVLADLSRILPQDRPLLFQFDDAVGPACRRLDDQPGEGADSYAYRQMRTIEKQKSAAEEKRLLYVAATRARDRLLLSGIVTEKNNGEWSKSNPNWGEILNWLGVEAAGDLPPDRTVIQKNPWGRARCYLAETPPSEEVLLATATPSEPRDSNQQQKTKKVDAPVPALLVEITPFQRQGLRHVSAGQLIHWPRQIEHSGIFADPFSDDDDEEYEGEFFGDTPRSRSKALGTLVHAALRKHPLPEEGTALKQYLKQLCWSKGIGYTQNSEHIITTAAQILESYRLSGLYRELGVVNPKTIHREYPFLFRGKNFVVHGRIDLIYQKLDGSWCIVDYKTSTAPATSTGESDLRGHARRYLRQLAAYHHALLHSPFRKGLHAAIHFLRFGQTVLIPPEDLHRAIAKLQDSFSGE